MKLSTRYESRRNDNRERFQRSKRNSSQSEMIMLKDVSHLSKNGRILTLLNRNFNSNKRNGSSRERRSITQPIHRYSYRQKRNQRQYRTNGRSLIRKNYSSTRRSMRLETLSTPSSRRMNIYASNWG